MSGPAATNLAVVERGSGPSVVFLHGYPLHHAMWVPELEDLSPEYRVTAVDLPGYGLSKTAAVPDTLGGFADEVHRSVGRRTSGPGVVVGHSFGGYVALEWLRRHPERFRALVLTNTRSEGDTPEARQKRLATARRLEEPGQGLDVEEVVRGLVAPATWQGGRRIVDDLRAIVSEAPTGSVRRTLVAIADRPDLTPVLSTIRVPTLVIWGEEDRLIPPEQTRTMITRIPGGSGAGIPGAGHVPSLETPESFVALLRSFLQEVFPVG